MTALPTERLSDPISVGLPGCPPAHCTCWERHYCGGMLRQEGGMTPEGLVDGVKAPPGLSALSLTGCLAWPGQLGPAQTRLSFHPALGLRLLIKLPFDPLGFLNRSPFDSLLARPLFFYFVLNGGSGFCSKWWTVWWTEYSCASVFGSLSTRRTAHSWDKSELLLRRYHVTDIIMCIWSQTSIPILFYIIFSGWIVTYWARKCINLLSFY